MTELRTLGRSGLATPRLVLGGNVFGWTATGEEAFRILDRFVDAGGTMIDTADVYSAWVPGHRGGESETLIGEWLRRRGSREGVLIASKVGMLHRHDGGKLEPWRIEKAAEASLKRLGVETIDLYYAHQDDPDTPMEAVIEAFDRLVKAGKVRALGASNFTARRLARALSLARELGMSRYEVLQNEFHLLERGKLEGELQRICLAEEIGVLPFYGLASGYLTGKYRSEADYGKSIRGDRMAKYLDGRGPAVLSVLDEISAQTGATAGQIALAWVAAQPAVAAPIASARTLDQLEELIGAMALELTPAQLATLNEVSAGSA
ncbi:aldo/keto reductase [Allosphingosinicella sp.]|uniref:aldo/keto reductase n=1 Tax=Allosphingosinicella sp. TaxID=2823234 RepID=UPI002EE41C72